MPRKLPSADNDEKEEEEDATSKFTTTEMWHRLPPGLQDAVFESLNLQQANRLCRVSKDWGFSLERVALINKGLVFLDCPVPGTAKDYYEPHPTKRFKRNLPWIWDELSFIRNRTVRTFVVFEDHPSCLNLEFGGDRASMLCAKLNVLRFAHPQLRTVIFSGGHRLSFGDIAVRSELLFGGKFKNVRFANFDVEHLVITASVFFNPPDNPKEFSAVIYWRPRVPLKDRLVTKKVMDSIETADANDPPTRAPGKPRKWKHYGRWLLTDNDYDPTRLFWPYPAEQLDWLKLCLSSLDSRSNRSAKKAVMASYVEYCRYNSGSSWNPKEQWTGNKGPLKKMGVVWPPKDKQELDVMDCAFLARVFSLTPGMPKPPCRLPDDFEKRVRNN